MKKIVALLIIACLLLVGCTADITVDNDTNDTNPTQEPSSDSTQDGIELPEVEIPVEDDPTTPTDPNGTDATDPTDSNGNTTPTNPNGSTDATNPGGNTDATNPGGNTDATNPGGNTDSQPTDPETVVYTITYEGLEGATHNNPATYTAENAASIVLAEPSAREGFSFEGWYIGGTRVISLHGQTGNLTITAKWKSTGPIELPDVDF